MIISAIYTDLISFISPLRALYRFAYIGILTLFSFIIIFQDFFVIVFFFAFAMLSHEGYIHRCELKTSLVERIISASERFSTPSVEPAGFQNPTESSEFQKDPFRNFRHHSTSPCVHVQVCKYVVIFLVFLQGCENHIFPFFQAELPRNIRSR